MPETPPPEARPGRSAGRSGAHHAAERPGVNPGRLDCCERLRPRAGLGGWPPRRQRRRFPPTPVTTGAHERAPARSTAPSTTTATWTPATTPATTAGLRPDGKSSARAPSHRVKVVRDAQLQPKSVVYSGNGLFFAQNMMYRHNVSVFDRSGAKIATIPDTVNLAHFGVAGGPTVQGSPRGSGVHPRRPPCLRVQLQDVRARGITPSPATTAGAATGTPASSTGSTPRRWPSMPSSRSARCRSTWPSRPTGGSSSCRTGAGLDVSVIDLATLNGRARIRGRATPRGIAITSDAATAYVAVMGEARIAAIDLRTFRHVRAAPSGADPAPPCPVPR